MQVNSALGQVGLVISSWSYVAFIFNKDASTILVRVCFIKKMLQTSEGILMFGRWSVNIDHMSQRVRLHNGSIRKMKQ